MESSTIKSKIAFKELVEMNLTYAMISKLTFEEYKDFVFSFFMKLDNIRNRGLKKEDADSIIRKQYSGVISVFDDNDIMFERRFEVFNEELLEFCSPPYFWQTSVEDYLKKWDLAFQHNWFKDI